MSSEFLFDIPPSSCYKIQKTYGFAHPEKLRDRPYEASATADDGANFGGPTNGPGDERGVHIECRLSLREAFWFIGQGVPGT